MLEDLFIADIFFIYLIIPVKKIFQSLGDKNETLGDKNETLGDKNGYSHPLFYGRLCGNDYFKYILQLKDF